MRPAPTSAATVRLLAALLLAACGKAPPPPLYLAVPVERRDIVVSAEAAGSVEPILVVDVKSKASGEVIELRVETGDVVEEGELLVRIDPRDPQNAVAQAQADLEVARAQLANAEAQKRRADQMFEAQVMSEQEHEAANLQYANARAQQVRAERSLQTARDQLDDTNVRAPITGTIIAKNVERGQVIASATREVSGGTVLLRMADLDEVQVRTLVDETDIGKVQAGMPATIAVEAYPNRPFSGTVLKIEPQAQVQQNVTMFPVLIRIANRQGLLRPGMSAEVELHVGERRGVLAVPNAALRTARDVGSAAQVLGLDPKEVEQTVASADSAARAEQRLAAARDRAAPAAPARGRAAAQAPAGDRAAVQLAGRGPGQGAGPAGAAGVSPGFGTRDSATARSGDGPPWPSRGRPGGGGFQLPAGVSEEQVQTIMRKRMSGEPLSPQENALAMRLRQMAMARGGGGGGGGGAFMGGGGGSESGPASAGPAGAPGPRRRFGQGNAYQFGGSYIVFVSRGGRPEPVRIRTGLTDLDYSEVVSGLAATDTVLVLPSASLVQQQRQMRERFTRMTGGGGIPGMQQQPASGAGGRTGAGAR